MSDITVQELKERMDKGTAPKVIDVREQHEWERDHLDVVHMPMGSIPMRLDELGDKNAEIVLACRSGGRSGQITAYLRSQGFTNARNLAGGMLAWKENIDGNFDVD